MRTLKNLCQLGLRPLQVIGFP